MYELRRQFPTLNDGYNLLTLSNRTYDIYLPGSQGIASPHGIWSVYRGRTEGVQDFAGDGQGNQGVWFVYHNENRVRVFVPIQNPVPKHKSCRAKSILPMIDLIPSYNAYP